MNRLITVEVDCYMGMIARTLIHQAADLHSVYLNSGACLNDNFRKLYEDHQAGIDHQADFTV